MAPSGVRFVADAIARDGEPRVFDAMVLAARAGVGCGGQVAAECYGRTARPGQALPSVWYALQGESRLPPVANVTEKQMESYLRAFHDEYTGTADRFLTAGQRARLLRYGLRPAQITGYVSTDSGAGYEYRVGEHAISTKRGSQPVEELWAAAPRRLLNVGPILAIGGERVVMHGGTMIGAFPFRFIARPADVTLVGTYFQAEGWSRNATYAQLFTTRTEEFWSEAQAVRRAKDEIFVAMVDVQQSDRYEVDLGTYLGEFKQRTVLLLGDFNHGRERLTVLRAVLDGMGYSTVLLDEVPEDPNYDLRQKFQAVASVSRFLVFDDSSPAGQIAELMLARNLDAIGIVLRETAKASSFMTAGLDLTSGVMGEWNYNLATAKETVSEAVAWAEAKVASLATNRDRLFPWRDEQPSA